MGQSSKARIGIVVPTGRFTPDLELTLRSIIFQNIDVTVAVYDASNDSRTKALIEKYREHLIYVHYGKDGGQANAISQGWSKLNAEIVGWLNDDDHLAPGTLKKVIEIIDENPSCSGVYGPSSILDQDRTFMGMHPAVDPTRINEIFSNNVISQPSCFVKYSKVKNVGGIDPSKNYTMDWDLWARLLQKFPDSLIYHEDILSAVTFAADTKTSELSVRRMFEIFSVTREYNSFLKSVWTVFAYFKWGVIQNFQVKKLGEFLNSQTNRYLYWNYDQDIVGIRWTGFLSPENIKDIQILNDLKMISADEQGATFSFKTPIPSGQICKITIKDGIVSGSIVFLT